MGNTHVRGKQRLAKNHREFIPSFRERERDHFRSLPALRGPAPLLRFLIKTLAGYAATSEKRGWGAWISFS